MGESNSDEGQKHVAQGIWKSRFCFARIYPSMVTRGEGGGKHNGKGRRDHSSTQTNHTFDRVGTTE